MEWTGVCVGGGVYFSVYFSVYLCLYLCVCVGLTVCLFRWLSVPVSLCLCASHWVSVSVFCACAFSPCPCPHTCKIPSISKKLPIPTSLLSVQLQVPNRNFFVPTQTSLTITFCFHNYALSCFILSETVEMLQQQDTLYFGYTSLGSPVQFQIIKNNRSCKLGLLHQLLLVMDWCMHLSFCLWLCLCLSVLVSMCIYIFSLSYVC